MSDINSVAGWKLGDFRSLEHQFRIEDLNAFAKLTGDYNPIHMDKSFASSSAAGGQVVHGMLLVSFISSLIIMESSNNVLFKDFQVNWKKMVRIGDRLRFIIGVTSVDSSLDFISLDFQGERVQNEEVCLTGSVKIELQPNCE